jgi:hypothetical protein
VVTTEEEAGAARVAIRSCDADSDRRFGGGDPVAERREVPMTRMLMTLMLSLVGSGFGETEKPVEKMVELKHLEGDRAQRAVNFVREVMGKRVRIVWEAKLGELMIVGGTADSTEQAEGLLRKLDVPEVKTPSKTLEFTIYLVGAFMDPTHVRGGPMPVDLDPVVKEMRSAFAYKSFGLLDTIPVRVTESATHRTLTDYSDILPEAAVGMSTKHFYKLHLDSPYVQDDGKTVSIQEFGFTVEIPAGPGVKAGESGVRTELTVREGQKVVLGKIHLDDQDTSAVFMVVTVKIL